MENDVNERIKAIIAHYGLTERAFSIRLGVPQMTINSLFKRNSVPSYTILNAIAEHFKGVSTEWLIRGSGDMLYTDELEQLRKEVKILRLKVEKDNATEKDERIYDNEPIEATLQINLKGSRNGNGFKLSFSEGFLNIEGK